MQTQKLVIAKIVHNKRINTFRVLFSFDTTNPIIASNTVLTSGDICDVRNDRADQLVMQTIRKHAEQLCANRIIVQKAAAARGLKDVPGVVDL